MEHKLLINQSRGEEKVKKRFHRLVFSWNITNTNVYSHVCMHPFLLCTFLYSFQWR